MADYDQELIDTYIEESREHLASIEEDLVELEKQGANRDDGLINKIFRAAHSIKGGAGFFEFKVIKELAHKLENVLDLIRSGHMVPNPEIVTILLRGFDRLSALIEDSGSSDSQDISEELVALIALADEYSQGQRLEKRIEKFSAPGSSRELEADSGELKRAQERGESIFLIRFDLIHDVHRLGKTPLDILHSLVSTGEILDSTIDFNMVGTLEDENSGDDVPFLVLFASPLSVRELSERHEIPQEGITLLRLATPVPSPGKTPAGTRASVPKSGDEPGPQGVTDPTALGAAKPTAKPADEPSSRTAFQEKGGFTVTQTQGQQGEPSMGAFAKEALEKKGPKTSAPAQSASVGTAENETVRVSVGVLDELMNLSGELVLVRNELTDGANRGVLTAVQAALQRMNAVTAGIQDAVTRSRMQGASTLFSRYQRTVRDLARDLGKQIELRVSGKETELDRSLIESLSDPLTHLVRNACDHGIELPEVRRAAGKAERGTITLSAAHEAGQVVIEVSDDGKGIDAETVGAKAVSMGLVTQERLALMSPKEKLYLITLPGLSTAKQVSDLSGRGVGMDVVKANVDRLGGRIDIDSQPGQGSRVRITLPLTLSIIPALIAGVGNERFALPQAAAAELLHIRAGDVQRRIERVGDRPVLVLRGEVLPLVRLADAIGMERVFEDPETGEPKPDRRQRVEDRRSASSDPERIRLAKKVEKWERSGDDRRFHASGDYRVIVVRASAFRYGVIVDELFDTTEIVVKPLGKHLKNLKEYSGATILGDGTIALIIDPAGLALTAGLTTAGESRDLEEAEESQGIDEAKSWLLFHNGETEQCAMSLEAVERVVRFDSSQIDFIGKDLFLRMDGGSLPVFSVASFTGLTPLSSSDASACVICHASGHRFGFLASPPVDSVAAEANLDDRSIRRAGLMGTAVIQGKTTVVIDPEGALSVLKPEWFSKPGAPGTPQAPRKEEAPRGAEAPIIVPTKTDSEAPLLVVAEDSDFFRTMITEILGTAGYRVEAAVDGLEALEKIRDLGGEAALVVTDVEMPRMDGRGLTQKIKEEFPAIPVIALTSLASEEDEKNLRNAGVQKYLVKLDRDELLGSIESILNAKERI